MSANWERVWTILPEYLSGLAWLACLASPGALTATPSDAFAFGHALSAVTQPLHLPDLAVGFLLAVFGILLPFAVGVVLGPLSFIVAEPARKAFLTRYEYTQLTEQHFLIITDRLKSHLGIPPPKLGLDYLLVLVLRDARSPLIDRIEHRGMSYNLQGLLFAAD